MGLSTAGARIGVAAGPSRFVNFTRPRRLAEEDADEWSDSALSEKEGLPMTDDLQPTLTLWGDD